MYVLPHFLSYGGAGELLYLQMDPLMKKNEKSGVKRMKMFESTFESLCHADFENQLHFPKYFGQLRS